MAGSASIPYHRIASFRRKILGFYAQHGRDLPWRHTKDPYRITISEIMLQQTQVERVIPKYEAWIALWPNWRTLSKASTRELLHAWSGLGYNRRALMLGKLAKAIVEKHHGKLPRQPELLEKLPGIGPYTSRAILIFAFNQDLATIDTNIRRVLLHQFDLPLTTTKEQLESLAQRLVPQERSRDWHNGLMDYSRLALPKRLSRIPPVSKQGRFEGSVRQVRGEIIRQLLKQKTVDIFRLAERIKRDKTEVRKIAESMAREGVVRLKGRTVTLAD